MISRAYLGAQCLGLGFPSGITVSWILFGQLFKLFMSCFPSSYDIISWIHVHAHSRDLMGDSTCRSDMNGGDIFRSVAACICQNDDREVIRLSCAVRAGLFFAVSPSLPNLGNGES